MRQGLALVFLCLGGSAFAEPTSDGRTLLESNCGRCHAVEPGAQSPREQAPNLSIVLQAYPADRLEAELTEGIRPKHPDMPQIRFSPSDVASIYYYLHGKAPESEYRRGQ
jgi:cytochrome c